MLRVVLGIIKGAVIGAAVGLAAAKAGIAGGAAAWLVYGVVGFLVGVLCGKAFWRHETMWTPVLKGVFGVLICCGLYWVATKVLGTIKVPFATVLWSSDDAIARVPALLAPAVGILYGTFVEVDDGERKTAANGGAAAPDKS